MALLCHSSDCSGDIIASCRTKVKYIFGKDCVHCDRSNLSHKENQKYYLCNKCRKWCCINCCGKLLYLQKATEATFHPICYKAYKQFVKDRFNGHNDCKLSEYQGDYEINLSLLTIGYILTKFNRDRVHNDLINIIILFINTKIKSFDTKKLSQSKQLSLNEELNQIT